MAKLDTTKSLTKESDVKSAYKKICDQEKLRDNLNPKILIKGIQDNAQELNRVNFDLNELRNEAIRGARFIVTDDSSEQEIALATSTLTKDQIQRINTIVKIDQARIAGLTALNNVYFKQLAKVLPDVPMVAPETLGQLEQLEPDSVESTRKQLTARALSFVKSRGSSAIH